MVISNATNGEYSKFTIGRVRNGLYQGLYFIMVANQYLSMNSSGTLTLSTSPTQYSYWSFMPVEKGWAELYSFVYSAQDADGKTDDYDSTANNNLFKSVLNSMGYSDNRAVVNSDSQTLYNRLQVNDILVFRGHGAPGVIGFYDGDGESLGCVTAHSLVYTGDNNDYKLSVLPSNSLANLRCVMYIGCNTGVPYELEYSSTPFSVNLVDVTFDKGAHFVLGTTKTIYTPGANAWFLAFLEAIQSGESIEDACIAADDQVEYMEVSYEKDDGTEVKTLEWGLPTYCRGDGNQYLSFE